MDRNERSLSPTTRTMSHQMKVAEARLKINGKGSSYNR